MNINGKHYRTIWPDPSDRTEIVIIDQRKLPHFLVTEKLRTVNDVIIAIKEMRVRGAGLIGVTAGYGIYLAALTAPDKGFDEYIRKDAARLENSRPTAKNLKWAVERVCKAMERGNSPEQKREIAFQEANSIADEDILFCRQIGKHGLEIIREISKGKKGKRVNILTHCNAGWLAFVDYGSATAPMYAARDAGIDIHVWVDETRPWNQGAKLTAWELQQEKIDNTLICDNTGGHLMQHGMVDLVIVGTDRTTHTGDVANKIGTYLKALAARDNSIPFYVALPSSTIDWTLDNGMEIPIEQRTGKEITTITGLDKNNSISTISLAADGTRTANYSFDVTPARLITGLITERGTVTADRHAIHSLFPEGEQINRQEQGIS
ncbi:S-methyl-5-thioribose-1-phosphate isomerase [Desulfomarina sp.]